jgi:hypothetical protein
MQNLAIDTVLAILTSWTSRASSQRGHVSYGVYYVLNDVTPHEVTYAISLAN